LKWQPMHFRWTPLPLRRSPPWRDESLQDTPLNGRDFTQLTGTSVSFSGYNNSGSVNGMRNNQLNYTIDGTDNNDSVPERECGQPGQHQRHRRRCLSR
jgi:hypothetical protein